jgi:hypothetical protein
MEGKILGVILSILGISGLIVAVIYMNNAADSKSVNLLLGCGILAAISFFAGLRLIPSGKRPAGETLEVKR